MRYAVIADVHANLEALDAVLAWAAELDVQRIVCLGDLVGYHANPDECVQSIRARGIFTVAGNQDLVATGLSGPVGLGPRAARALAWTRPRLSAATREYIARLPLVSVVDEAFVMCHGSLASPHQRVTRPAHARAMFQDLEERYPGYPVCFFGHTHVPAVWASDGGVPHRLPAASEVSLRDDACYLVSPGSVGDSRDGDPRASFAVFDSSEALVEFHRVTYDILTAERKTLAGGLRPRRRRRVKRPVRLLRVAR
jgi:diadenosine tetraphosphatase ApaH/serine/threonine PP2A family protein phosphatase